MMNDDVSNPFIILGTHDDSRCIALKSDKRKRLFNARKTTTFKIILPNEIGDVNYIRIFHDNSGRFLSYSIFFSTKRLVSVVYSGMIPNVFSWV